MKLSSFSPLASPMSNLIVGIAQALTIGNAFRKSMNGLVSEDIPNPARSTVELPSLPMRYASPRRGRNSPAPDFAPVSHGTPVRQPVNTFPVAGSKRLIPVLSLVGNG